MKTFNDLAKQYTATLESEIDGEVLALFLRFYGEEDSDQILIDQDVFEKLDYDGSLHELIDGQIDIYYHSLRVWSVDNWAYVEDAISDGLADGTDHHKSIQAGQYLSYQEDTYNELRKLIELLNEI